MNCKMKQAPVDYIVGIYEDKSLAAEKYKQLSTQTAPLMYSCPLNRVKYQSGYNFQIEDKYKNLKHKNGVK